MQLRIQKSLYCLEGKNKIDPNLYVHCLIVGYHGNLLCNDVGILFKQKIQLLGTFRGCF